MAERKVTLDRKRRGRSGAMGRAKTPEVLHAMIGSRGFMYANELRRGIEKLFAEAADRDEEAPDGAWKK